MSSFRSHIATSVATFLLVMTPVVTHAALTPDNTGLKAAAPSGLLVNACEGSTNCLAIMAGKIIEAALGFIGILLLGLFIWGGFMWMTAAGETEKVTKAQGVLANAIAGVVIVAMSFAITSFVLERLDSVASSPEMGRNGSPILPP